MCNSIEMRDAFARLSNRFSLNAIFANDGTIPARPRPTPMKSVPVALPRVSSAAVTQAGLESLERLAVAMKKPKAVAATPGKPINKRLLVDPEAEMAHLLAAGGRIRVAVRGVARDLRGGWIKDQLADSQYFDAIAAITALDAQADATIVMLGEQMYGKRVQNVKDRLAALREEVEAARLEQPRAKEDEESWSES